MIHKNEAGFLPAHFLCGQTTTELDLRAHLLDGPYLHIDTGLVIMNSSRESEVKLYL